MAAPRSPSLPAWYSSYFHKVSTHSVPSRSVEGDHWTLGKTTTSMTCVSNYSSTYNLGKSLRISYLLIAHVVIHAPVTVRSGLCMYV